MAISVNMLGLTFLIEDTARSKKGQPPQRTTGVVRMNWIQIETCGVINWWTFGSISAIARMNTGSVRIAEITKRRRMSTYS